MTRDQSGSKNPNWKGGISKLPIPKERKQEYTRRYRLKHPNQVRDWAMRNKEHRMQHQREYRAKHPEAYEESKRRALLYTPIGRKVSFKRRVRTGYCSRCSNNIHDGSCKRTALHHIQYHDDDPLKDTIELCGACHLKRHPIRNTSRRRDHLGRFTKA